MIASQTALAIFAALAGIQAGVSDLAAQDPAPPARQGEQTPPIQPKIAPVPLPPAVVLPGPPNPQADAVRPLSADEAAKIALRLHPTLDLARAQILSAEGRAQAARSGLVPNVSLGGNFNRTIDLSTGQTSNGAGGNGGNGNNFGGMNANVSVNQLLFDFNHTRDLVRQNEFLARAAQQNLTRAQNDLVLNVKNAFYAYVQNERLVSAQEANLANTQAQLALAQARVDAGIGAPSDVVQAQTAVAAAAQAVAQARQTATLSRITLATAMGIDPRTPIAPSAGEEPAPDSEDVGALVDIAIKNRPEIRQIQETLRATGYELSAARTTNSPSIGLVLSANGRGTNDLFDTTTGSIGISVNWNFIDGGQTAGLVKQARADVQTAQANLVLTSQTVVQDVSQAFVTLKTAEQRVEIARSQVTNATEAVRLAEGRFRAGFATFLEVTNAQANLVTAQTALINAEASIQQARASLRRAIGRI